MKNLFPDFKGFETYPIISYLQRGSLESVSISYLKTQRLVSIGARHPPKIRELKHNAS
ncbi:hypothetical protein LEP1GSC043_1981 [Leptospira weilii str. Ecochallenge]|uniref:Uncharacterized protein n=3 Tax=Leptospira weilii TaxID=28184 RepID=N1UGJ5_9LEPT|nr:hypothetical protein LEP1GSC051_3701 [Leptospira sp. P2653]EMM72896.1 hypothetical protein LEP1GSC038_3556 [Leptospira weilii str. 2006001855]EMN44397.1 hypothetical protein LEP1GSC086_3490 [Leptospira weilii str. LNT 1234]EMN89332.1 hypothetical protein LEP1GSC108_4529 [Leptospira weilii str. UI 13098]EMY15140.1 hypothetical protein LEP1GSC043_1981 [Leptospira weilii str. Ecochallenge]